MNITVSVSFLYVILFNFVVSAIAK